MDPTTKVISAFITICFFGYLIHSFFAGLNGTAKKVMKIDDNFRLGYIESPKPQSVVVEQKIQKQPDLKQECFRVLKAIGYSEATAKSMVVDFFKKDTAKDLEEFFVKINKS
jgi:Holliday junction resolvasome RuvABC DNA-binding subunit